MHQSIDGGAGEGLVGKSAQQVRDQADLVGDNVIGNQAQLGLATGEDAVLLVLDDGHGDVGALRTGAAGGGDGNDVLLVDHGEALEVQVVDGVGTLAAQQLAQVHDGAAADGDDAVIAVVGDGVVHGLDHGLGGLTGAELLLEHEVALQTQVLHEGGVNELVGQHHVPLVQLELFGHLGEGLELVHGGSEDDLSLISHQRGGKSIHSHWNQLSFDLQNYFDAVPAKAGTDVNRIYLRAMAFLTAATMLAARRPYSSIRKS